MGGGEGAGAGVEPTFPSLHQLGYQRVTGDGPGGLKWAAEPVMDVVGRGIEEQPILNL